MDKKILLNYLVGIEKKNLEKNKSIAENSFVNSAGKIIDYIEQNSKRGYLFKKAFGDLKDYAQKNAEKYFMKSYSEIGIQSVLEKYSGKIDELLKLPDETSEDELGKILQKNEAIDDNSKDNAYFELLYGLGKGIKSMPWIFFKTLGIKKENLQTYIANIMYEELEKSLEKI